MKEFQLEVITPEKIVFSGKVKSVSVPGTKGNFQVLFNHAPLMSTLEIGKIKIEIEEGKEYYFATSGGTIEVNKNKVLILAETFESPDNINLERAKEALDRAQKRLLTRKDIDIQRAEGALGRAKNRLDIAAKYKSANA
ncbi:MAG: F0F1 ATP synthase subunit epsilon [Ignavibacteriales bacterium]|nr:F0F1 ATP synthase subunit epsilon [Ignavibacteriales bacterium]